MKELNKFSAFLLYYVVISFLPRFLDIVHCHLSLSFLSPQSPQPWESFLSSGFSLAQGLLRSSILSPRPSQPKPSPAQGLPSPMASQPRATPIKFLSPGLPQTMFLTLIQPKEEKFCPGTIRPRSYSAREQISLGTIRPRINSA
jgi:hypothetical protein